jgi:hypothetical protein
LIFEAEEGGRRDHQASELGAGQEPFPEWGKCFRPSNLRELAVKMPVLGRKAGGDENQNQNRDPSWSRLGQRSPGRRSLNRKIRHPRHRFK